MSDESTPEGTTSAPGGVPAGDTKSVAPAGIRASDEDREDLISQLNEHTVAGRLGTDELEERTQAAYAARTTAELDALRRDLPATKAEIDRAYTQRRRLLTHRMVQETGGSAILFGVATAVWLLSGATGQFWPVWILVIVLITLGRNAWALYGPGADLDAFEQHLNDRRDRKRDHGRGRRLHRYR